MRRRVLLFGAMSLAALALAFSSCAQSAETSTGPTATVRTPTGATPAQPTTAPSQATTAAKETPKYGGVLTLVSTAEPVAFGDINPTGQTWPQRMTNQDLLTGDWAKGAAGTGEFEWTQASINRADTKVGQLAESWEIPKPGIMTFKMRQGVHWALDPDSAASRLVNGREVTAADVVSSLNRYITDPRAYTARSYPQWKDTFKITAPDKNTVQISCPPESFVDSFSTFPDGMHSQVFPADLVNKYGDLMQDWRNNVGSGAFILKDYVPASSLAFVKNPNYWEKDPCGPGKGNQLPYLDGVKFLIITDPSTLMAALRTAKIDWGSYFGPDDAKAIRQTAPGLEYLTFFAEATHWFSMRLDKADLPFKDKRVRRALMMATDFNTIRKELYDNEAELVAYPLAEMKEFKDAYLPLDKAPESVQELWKYNPDKAKLLLAEAGYPNGFKTKVLVQTTISEVDEASIVKAMWAKVGVDLEIQLKEPAVYTSIANARSNDEMSLVTWGNTAVNYMRLITVDGTSRNNASFVNDPHVKEVKAQMYESFNQSDFAKVDRLQRELMGYILDQAWAIPLPAPHRTMFWWPWLKNYHAEVSVGQQNGQDWARYVWLDQALKESMIGRR